MMTAAQFNAVRLQLHDYPQDSGVGLIILKTKYAVITGGNLLVVGTQAAHNIVVNTTNLLNVTVTINGTLTPTRTR